MRSTSDIFQKIGAFFTEFNYVCIVEWVLIAMLFYLVMKVLYENGASKLLLTFFVAVIGCSAIVLFSEDVFIDTVFVTGLLMMCLCFLMFFSIEIKRSIWKKSTAQAITTSVSSRSKQTPIRTEECISAIIKAVQNMAKQDVGALIVLSNGNLPREITGSGVTLNASVSSQLIEGIFVPKAPLHDGALIILGDKIQAAGCFLPLSQRDDLSKDFGTRHRAAIGITEAVETSTIVVSEETGIVSIVKKGEITRYVDSDSLRKFLREYYTKEFNQEGKKA